LPSVLRLRFGLFLIAALESSCEKVPAAPVIAYCHSVDVEGQAEKCFATYADCDRFLEVFNVPPARRNCGGVAAIWCYRELDEWCFPTQTACVRTRDALENEATRLVEFLGVAPREVGQCKRRLTIPMRSSD
jgi:hypothetical protein